MKRLQVEPEDAFHPEIARWMWALGAVRRRTLGLVERMDQPTLDWEGTDGRDNAIGSLLYHIGLVETEWLHLDVLHQEIPGTLQADYPLPAEDAEGRLTRVPRIPLAEHLARLERSRRILLEAFRAMPHLEWRRLRPAASPEREVTPEWVVFHLIEHEAGHAFQISMIKARAERLIGPPTKA